MAARRATGRTNGAAAGNGGDPAVPPAAGRAAAPARAAKAAVEPSESALPADGPADLARLTAELEEARRLAVRHAQSSAAISATMGKARLHGLLAEGGPAQARSDALDGLSDDELKGRLARLVHAIAALEARGDGGGEPAAGAAGARPAAPLPAVPAAAKLP